MIALGLDPGFASFGWAVVALGPDHDELLALGVARTKKTDEQLKRDDQHRRCALIMRELLDVTARWRPDVICAEALTLVPDRGGPTGAGGRHRATSVAAAARVWGLVDALAEVHQVALVQVAPVTIKKAVTGAAKASKADVQRALDQRYHGRLTELLSAIRAKTKHEHPVDALGAVVACRNHNAIRIALRQREPLAARADHP